MDRRQKARHAPGYHGQSVIVPPRNPDLPVTGNELHYVTDPAARTFHSNLQPGECTIYQPPGSEGHWYMRFCFYRTTDGKPEIRLLPVNPNGGPEKQHHSWGLKRTAIPGRWQIAPSIQCLEQRRHPDFPDDPEKYVRIETWHQTPAIVGVPDSEPWTTAVS